MSWQRAALVDPRRFHFYQHIPPQELSWREQFDRVPLHFVDSEFQEPR
jgi:hypothetical protein